MSNVDEFGKLAGETGGTETDGPAPLAFNPLKYSPEMDQFDISEQQKQELLATLWSIMRSFVELGFQADVCAMVFPDGSVRARGGNLLTMAV